jgi:branched-chain amino acid transport system substrate-binding protein
MAMYAPNPEDAAVAERQYRQLGSPFKWIGTPATVERDALNLAKEAAEGLIGVTDWVPGQSDVSAKYGDAYKKEYNEDFDPTSAWTYDGLNILVNAIKKGGEDKNKIKDALSATQGYKGVLGSFSFTPQGDGIHEVSVIQVENANHKLLKVVNVGNK